MKPTPYVKCVKKIPGGTTKESLGFFVAMPLRTMPTRYIPYVIVNRNLTIGMKDKSKPATRPATKTEGMK